MRVIEEFLTTKLSKSIEFMQKKGEDLKQIILDIDEHFTITFVETFVFKFKQAIEHEDIDVYSDGAFHINIVIPYEALYSKKLSTLNKGLILEYCKMHIQEFMNDTNMILLEHGFRTISGDVKYENPNIFNFYINLRIENDQMLKIIKSKLTGLATDSISEMHSI